MRLAAPLLVASVCLAQDAGLRREGPYWVETATGRLELDTASRLRVVARGAVTVRGDAAAGEIRYTLRKRVAASSETEARRLLGALRVEPSVKGSWALVALETPGRLRYAPEMEIVAPRALTSVVMETPGGALRAFQLDGEVQAESGGGSIEADQVGGMLIARTAGGDVTLGQIGGAVRCVTGGGSIRVKRAGGEATFETAGGEIIVEEAVGRLRAVTGGGNIYVTRAGASVSARTAGGLISVLHADGAVEAETEGGPIRVGAAKDVRCESAAGMIALRGVSGRLRALTSLGTIRAELPAGVRLENSTLSTDAGDVIVVIPSNLAVTIRAVNESTGRLASIVSDFVEIRPSPLAGARSRQVAEGALNGGGPLLTIAASNGTIYLRRTK
jgi:hypothetical protein